MPSSYLSLSKADARWLLRRLSEGPTNPRSKQIATKLVEYLRRFDNPRFQRENGIRKLAAKPVAEGGRHDEGISEVDPDNAVVSEGEDNGAYIMTWEWFPFDGTRFDKEK